MSTSKGSRLAVPILAPAIFLAGCVIYANPNEQHASGLTKDRYAAPPPAPREPVYSPGRAPQPESKTAWVSPDAQVPPAQKRPPEAASKASPATASQQSKSASVPVPADKAVAAADAKAADAKAAEARATEAKSKAPVKTAATATAKPSAPSAGAPASASTAAAPQVIEVKSRETLEILSQRYGVSISAILTANKLNTTSIVPGQKLVIPRGEPTG